MAVPPDTSAGTFIERKRVEFCPFVGGSGKNESELRVKRAVALEQSVTDAWTYPRRKTQTASNVSIHAVNGSVYVLCLMPYVFVYFPVSMGVACNWESVIVLSNVYCSRIGQNLSFSELDKVSVESNPVTIELYTDGYNVRSESIHEL